MQNVRFMPAATWGPGFMGPVRLAGGWTGATPVTHRLGQLYTPPSAPRPDASQPGQDLPRVVSQDEIVAETKDWTKDQAISAFNMVNLLRSIMEKLQFSKAQFGKVWADPKVSAAAQKAGVGTALNNTVASLNELIRRMTLPNLMASALNMRAAFEIRVLPRFGVEVRGFVPLFRGQNWAKPNILDCTRIGMTGPMRTGMTEILDFGNLCETGFFTDIEAFKAASKTIEAIAPEIRLSGPSLGIAWPLVALILGGAVLAFGATVYFVNRSDTVEAAKALIENPEVRKSILEACNELPLAQRNDCIKEAFKNPALYKKGEPPSDVWMWVGIGAAAITVTWIITRLAESGIFGKGKEKA